MSGVIQHNMITLDVNVTALSDPAAGSSVMTLDADGVLHTRGSGTTELVMADTAAVTLQTAAAQAAAEATAAAALAAHAVTTTAVHGIPDTAVLETESGAQAKADAALAAALAADGVDFSQLSDVYVVDPSFTSATPGWYVTAFDNLTLAIAGKTSGTFIVTDNGSGVNWDDFELNEGDDFVIVTIGNVRITGEATAGATANLSIISAGGHLEFSEMLEVELDGSPSGVLKLRGDISVS